MGEILFRPATGPHEPALKETQWAAGGGGCSTSNAATRSLRRRSYAAAMSAVITAPIINCLLSVVARKEQADLIGKKLGILIPSDSGGSRLALKDGIFRAARVPWPCPAAGTENIAGIDERQYRRHGVVAAGNRPTATRRGAAFSNLGDLNAAFPQTPWWVRAPISHGQTGHRTAYSEGIFEFDQPRTSRLKQKI